MSVLSDLFQEIADAIRTKTGEEEKFPPADFADKILSIVAGSGDGGGSGGGSGGSSIGGLIVKTGSTTTGKRTSVGHGLGQLPDLVIAVANTSLNESFTTFTAKQRLIAAYGFRSGIPGLSRMGAVAISVASFDETAKLLYNSAMTMMTGDGMDALSASDEKVGFIAATPSTISIGSDHANVVPCASGYTWVAISGLGGSSSNDVRYVTFLNYDERPLGIKAVAVGDDCADPIERGVFSTPVRSSDVQYDYTFSGWSTTANGSASSTALQAVTDNRTLYAAYTGTVRKYTITYYDTDGTVMKTESLPFGATPSYKPTHESYVFDKWVPAVTTVTGDAEYTVLWSEKPSFADSSWAKIAEISESGRAAEYFSIGDSRIVPVTVDGSTYNFTAKIVGFNHDEMEDGSKAGITCIFFTVQGTYAFNSSGGSWTNYSRYTAGTYYSVAKNYGDTAYFLPEDLRSVLKPVKKEDNSRLSTTLNTLYLKTWIPSLTELGASSKDNITNQKLTLGKQYPFFATACYGCPGDNNSYPDVLVKTGDGSKTTGYFWARGMVTTGSYGAITFMQYSSAGAKMVDSPPSTLQRAYRIPIGFCI